ncbi:trichothecene C-15 hydroxylase [Podospora aff. communis PSN243]|uniref:Trichothecene C-15 hydroxylase n=1 Tax=Podospora aff. communis PSN243 TaxID=3040156 RepID=A0AAV9GCU5_9PEZI|nr:trichothecene C-15 hydroxylase [Podospora aff. communis PSN243]
MTLSYTAATIFLILCSLFAYRVSIVIHNLYFHPLSRIPGPRLYACSRLPKLWHNNIRGRHWAHLRHLHNEYGDVVRIAPDEVSFVSPQAWKDIAGHKTNGKLDFPRDLNFVALQSMGTRDSIISPVKSEHRQIRRLLQTALSEAALATQEPLILHHCNNLLASLAQHCPHPNDLDKLFVFSTFDTMGSLTFSSSFACLPLNRTHPIIHLFEASKPALAILQLLHHLPLFSTFQSLLLTPFLRKWVLAQKLSSETLTSHQQISHDENDPPRQDIMTTLLTSNSLSRHQADGLAYLFCQTGVETVSGTLSGLFYWLLRTPHAYRRLVEEIREAFAADSEIDLARTAKLSYLTACIQEGLRKHMFLAGWLPRRVPVGGAMVDGWFLPEGTICGVPHWAAGHVDSNFGEPDSFLPERWLPGAEGDERFAGDRRRAVQPFGTGGMDCVGRKLSWAQLRLMTVKVLWAFDIELRPESSRWASNEEAKITLFRQKVPLWVNVRKAEGGRCCELGPVKVAEESSR